MVDDIVAEQITETTAEISSGDGLIDATQNVIMNAAENVSEALGVAGKTAVEDVAELPFYAEVEFWVGMAFVLSVCVLFKPLGKFIRKAMQNRVNKVISDIEEAAKLRDDAQTLLADYQRSFINAEKEAHCIVENARKSVQNIKNNELAKLKIDLENKEKEANRRIAASNAKVAEEISSFAGTASVELANKVINNYLQSTDKTKLIDEAIAELDKFEQKA